MGGYPAEPAGYNVPFGLVPYGFGVPAGLVPSGVGVPAGPVHKVGVSRVALGKVHDWSDVLFEVGYTKGVLDIG